MRRSICGITRGVMWCSLVGSLVGSTGCGSDSTGPAINPASQYRSLTLNYHAVTLATVSPYDTVTLVATPRVQDGTPLATSDTVIYTSSDTSVVVSQMGKVQAHATSTVTGIIVIARMTVGGAHGVTLYDSALVNVVKPPTTGVPLIKTFAIDPVKINSSDSTSRSSDYLQATCGGSTHDLPKCFPARILDGGDSVISPVQVHYRYDVFNQTAIYPDRNAQQLLFGVGKVMIYADAYVYSKAVADSFLLTVGYPLKRIVDLDTSMATGRATIKGFANDTTFMGVGGTVFWRNYLSGVANDSADIEFADPTNVLSITKDTTLNSVISSVGKVGLIITYKSVKDSGGNIAPFAPFSYILPDTSVRTILLLADTVSTHGRRFPVAGTYPYHSRFFPGVGVVQVIPNSSVR